MAVKMIAMDLDGTLLNRQKEISTENQKALEDAAAQGVELVVSTGRALETIPPCVRNNPVFKYAICSNGAEIYRFDTGECLATVALNPHSVDAVWEVLKGEPVAWEVFVQGNAYAPEEYVKEPWTYGIPSPYIGYIKNTRIPVKDIYSFIRENRERISVLDLVVGDPEVRDRSVQKLKDSGEPLYVTASMVERIEILNPAAGKGPGIQLLCQILGIDLRDVVTFGDADNDLDMIRLAGIGIAMGNAFDDVKEQADYVTCDNDHHGVAMAIRKRLGIISKEERKTHEHFMREALRQAKKAEALDEVPIGCVIVKENQVIARGYNRRNTDQNTLSHAELNAIRKASKKLGDWRLEGCTMYITLEPCQMCAGALVQSRIDRIVLGGRNPKAGCAGSILNLLDVKEFNHQVEVVDGILTEECGAQLSRFFRDLRDRKRQDS